MLKKRITSIFLSIFIVIGVVVSDYCNVMAVDIPTAFWGTLEYSRAFFTAMQTGGAFDRGINFEDFTRSTQRQWQNLAPKVMEAYQLFCFYKEKVVVSAEHPDWTMEQINSEAVTRSFKLKNDFEDNAIKVQSTTGNITLKDWKYWQEFCKEFSDIAKNGVGGNIGSSDINDNTVISGKAISLVNGFSFNTETSKSSLGSKTFVYNDLNYINKFVVSNGSNIIGSEETIGGVMSDRVRIPYLKMISYDWSGGGFQADIYAVDVNILTQEIITISNRRFVTNINPTSDFEQLANDFAANSSLPVIYVGSDWDADQTYINNNGFTFLAVNEGGSSQTLDWQYKAQEALDDSEAGSAIKKGNASQSAKTVVREGSVPIKRSSLKEGEEEGSKVVSGQIGWDIPQSRVIEGQIANPAEEDEEIRQIGVIDVPEEDIVTPNEDDTEIVVPEDAEIVRPDIPDLPVPIAEIIKIQYGPFYPTSMDITEFFPFCIPFDIAYCINKFRVGEGEAPVVTIPIVYPRVLQGTLGE